MQDLNSQLAHFLKIFREQTDNFSKLVYWAAANQNIQTPNICFILCNIINLLPVSQSNREWLETWKNQTVAERRISMSYIDQGFRFYKGSICSIIHKIINTELTFTLQIYLQNGSIPAKRHHFSAAELIVKSFMFSFINLLSNSFSQNSDKRINYA